GRFDEAERFIADSRSLGERVHAWEAAMYSGLQLYVLRRELGKLDELNELIRGWVRDAPTYPIWRCVLANTLAELGSTVDARAGLDALAADRFAAIPFDEEWEVSLGLLTEAAARLDDRGRAQTLYELLLPYADRVATSYPEVSLGPVSRYLGILAATTGHHDDAADHFDQALAMSKRIGARSWLARGQDDYAHLLLRRGAPGDVEKAGRLLGDARTTYRELGMGSSPSSLAAGPETSPRGMSSSSTSPGASVA